MDLATIPNLNWLIHMAFVRQDYKYCNEVIEYQFSETYDHEYLYYIKVKIMSISFLYSLLVFAYVFWQLASIFFELLRTICLVIFVVATCDSNNSINGSNSTNGKLN